jgi:hypothetical protein
MGVHGLMALRAAEAALELFRGRRVRGHDGAVGCGPEVGNQSGEFSHADERAVAALAIEETMMSDGSVEEQDGADGTFEAVRFAEDADAVLIFLRNGDLFAKIANERIAAFEKAHRSTATRAGHGDIIGREIWWSKADVG